MTSLSAGFTYSRGLCGSGSERCRIPQAHHLLRITAEGRQPLQQAGHMHTIDERVMCLNGDRQ